MAGEWPSPDWSADLGLGGPYESGAATASVLPLAAPAAPAAAAAPQAARLRELLAAAARLGARLCAVAVQATAPLRARDACRVPLLPPPEPGAPAPDALAPAPGGGGARKRARAGALDAGRKRARGEGAGANSGAAGAGAGGGDGGGGGGGGGAGADAPGAPARARAPWAQLSRITVALPQGTAREAADCFARDAQSLAVLASYDLVAAQPGSAEAMLECARSGAVDIIDLDAAGGRAPFALAQADVEAVLAAGVVFELPYAPSVRDAGCRRHSAANAAALLRLTRGRGVVLTSQARAPLELRGAREAAAVAGSWGMTRAQARAALALGGAGVRAALAHAEARLSRARGGVSLHAGAPLAPPASLAPPAGGAQGRTGGGGGGAGGAGGGAGTQAEAMAAHAAEAAPAAGAGAAPSGAPARPWLASLGARGVAARQQGWVIALPPPQPHQ